MAFFSSLFTSLNNNDINYMILNNTLPFPDTDFCNYAFIDNLLFLNTITAKSLDSGSSPE